MAFSTQDAAKNIIQFIFSTRRVSSQYINLTLIRALFWKKNSQFLHEVQSSLESFFVKLLEEDPASLLTEIQIARGIALLPFLDLQKKVRVPQKIGNAWHMIDYDVEPLILTPSSLGSPLQAYALTAPDQPTLLLFKGTPSPTSSGYLLSIWTDFVPGFSVGELAFHLFAKKRIKAFLTKAPTPVKIYGQSLGGALSLLTACYFQVDEVHAFAPPPLFKRTLAHFQKGDVSIYWHINDPVPFIGGSFHPSWKFFKIEGANPQNAFLSHLRCVPGPSKITPETCCKGKTGSWLPFWHFLVSIPVFVLTSSILLLRAPFYMWQKPKR